MQIYTDWTLPISDQQPTNKNIAEKSPLTPLEGHLLSLEEQEAADNWLKTAATAALANWH